MSTIYPALPLNAFVVERLQKYHTSLAPKTVFVGVQHLLDDTLDMYKGIIALGIPADQMFSLGKCYSNIPRVIAEMKKLGVTVIPTTQPDLGEFYPAFQADIKQLWQAVSDYVRTHDVERIIVLDDGGIAITAIPETLCKTYIVCGEEQTTSGLYTFEKNPPHFDIVSEASSAVKLMIESPLFTKAAVERVIDRAKEKVDFKDKKVGIIGMGSIGTSLAVILARLGAEVYSLDITPKKAYDIPDDVTITPTSSLEEIISTCQYCFGCTGRDIFEGFELPLRHHPELVLISVSSGDREFLSLINYIKTQKYTFDTLSKDIHFKTEYGAITILQQGFPINFDGTQGSAAPEKTQLTTAMLLVGLVQAYLHCQVEKNTKFNTILMHSPSVQKVLLMKYFEILPEMKKMYTEDLLKAVTGDQWYSDNSGGTYQKNEIFETIFAE